MSAPQQRRRSLRLSVLDGALHAAMVGVSESFLGVLAVKLGHEALALAVLSTLPLAIGALAQLLSPSIARGVGGTERLVVLGAVG